ncbi:complex I NDUFA9 subunit family protein [Yunchengibacter salinarum]|uniref:complex I NDUFA9 subunit family protein n=1 Tax=Yunchengibacter salinarum TaxID=3133399 RepID=UPI0035B67213
MSRRVVTVIGGSGFIGRYLVQKLAARGDRVRVAVRRPDEALFLKPLGAVGQITPFSCNVRFPRSVARAVAGADTVVNLVGVLHDQGANSFSNVQDEGAGIVAEEAARAGVETLVHMSAIGADARSPSRYARSKALGEEKVRKHFKKATIMRPSVVFGVEDDFFNRFAQMSRFLPVLPIPGAETRFQPVYVGDVADAIVAVVDGGKGVAGQTFELGGPHVLTLRECLKVMMKHTGRPRPVVNVPTWLAKIQGAVLGLLPNPPLTLDQVKLLEKDNVVAGDARTLTTLGLKPTPLDAVLPRYMVQYKPHGQFSEIGTT